MTYLTDFGNLLEEEARAAFVEQCLVWGKIVWVDLLPEERQQLLEDGILQRQGGITSLEFLVGALETGEEFLLRRRRLPSVPARPSYPYDGTCDGMWEAPIYTYDVVAQRA